MEPADAKRRLSAILMSDVAGYSRLMGEDETATVRTLTSLWFFALPSAPGFRTMGQSGTGVVFHRLRQE